MRRALFSVERDREWTAWDCRVRHIYIQPQRFRRIVRRAAKRRERRIIAKYIDEAIEDMTSDTFETYFEDQ